jgi:hypothetical protein
MMRTTVLSETRSEAGLWLIRVLRGGLELGKCLGETAGRANGLLETAPRTLVPDPGAISKENDPRIVASQIRALARLRGQLGRIEALSSLPQPERDRHDLARKRHTGQLFPHSAGNHAKVDVLQGTWSPYSR